MKRRSFIAISLLWIASLLGGCGDPDRRSTTRSEPKAPAPPEAKARTVLAASKTASDASPPTAPAVNWVLPIFTDREGYRSMTLRGTSVRPGADGSIAVEDLNVTVFDEKPDPKVDTVLLSPSALFFPKQNLARGDKAVRLIRDDIEVTGVGWSYDHAAKKVSLHHNVRVTFRAQLNDILK